MNNSGKTLIIFLSVFCRSSDSISVISVFLLMKEIELRESKENDCTAQDG